MLRCLRRFRAGHSPASFVQEAIHSIFRERTHKYALPRFARVRFGIVSSPHSPEVTLPRSAFADTSANACHVKSGNYGQKGVGTSLPTVFFDQRVEPRRSALRGARRHRPLVFDSAQGGIDGSLTSNSNTEIVIAQLSAALRSHAGIFATGKMRRHSSRW